MTSFFLDLVFGSTTSCGTSESHAFLPKAPHTSHRVGS
jgi:hypothetical protein